MDVFFHLYEMFPSLVRKFVVTGLCRFPDGLAKVIHILMYCSRFGWSLVYPISKLYIF